MFKHLSVIPAAGVPKDCTLKAELQRVYGTSIYAQAQEAIAIATDAVMGVRLRYTRQHGALVRTCAECGMGEFSEKWRIWWVTDGLLACKEHFNNKHENCGKFLPYCRCGHGEAYEQDEKSWWSELAPSTGNPEGVQDLCGVILDAWTLGPWMTDCINTTILYVRSSAAESFFSTQSRWLYKSLHFTPWAYRMGSQCLALSWNARVRLQQKGRAKVSNTRIQCHVRGGCNVM